MQTQPPDLSAEALSTALVAGWQIIAESIEYAPVGFGSHHWFAVDRSGRRWFLTADAVGNDPVRLGELRAALCTAATLRREAGLTFIGAPIPRRDGGLLEPVGRYAVAVYLHLVEVPKRGDNSGSDGVVELLAALHAATPAVEQIATIDDLVLPERWSLQPRGPINAELSAGPYAAPFCQLLVDHRETLAEALRRYDRLAVSIAADRDDWVITHGEPKANNIMITQDGPVLIDWDTARVAPPERDLWMTGAHQRYFALTGRRIRPDRLDFFRLRWELADLASFGSWLRQPHRATPDNERAWNGAVEICARLADGKPGPPWSHQGDLFD